MEKFKKILLYILVYVVALAVGGVLAAIGEKITALGFLSTAMDWGFHCTQDRGQTHQLIAANHTLFSPTFSDNFTASAIASPSNLCYNKK